MVFFVFSVNDFQTTEENISLDLPSNHTTLRTKQAKKPHAPTLRVLQSISLSASTRQDLGGSQRVWVEDMLQLSREKHSFIEHDEEFIKCSNAFAQVQDKFDEQSIRALAALNSLRGGFKGLESEFLKLDGVQKEVTEAEDALKKVEAAYSKQEASMERTTPDKKPAAQQKLAKVRNHRTDGTTRLLFRSFYSLFEFFKCGGSYFILYLAG